MRADKIVQFVCFETTLGTDQFIKRWEQYSRSVNSDADVTLQQSEKNGTFKYVAQHRCQAGELQFVFAKEGRSSRTPQVEIKAKQAGGYTILQAQKMTDAHADESKVFAFLNYPHANLDEYRKLSNHSKLNIYEAYYESCQYAYILEYFVKTKYLGELHGQLKQHNGAESEVYKEFVLVPE
jgi:hypothetical protein